MGKITKNNLKVGDKIEFKNENWGIYKVERLYNENPHIWNISNGRGGRTLSESELDYWQFVGDTTKPEIPPPIESPTQKCKYFVCYRKSLAKYLDENSITYVTGDADILCLVLEGNNDESLFVLLEAYFKWNADQY